MASAAVGSLKVDDSTNHVTGGGGDGLRDISVAEARQEEGEQDGPKHAGAAFGLEMWRCHML